MAVVVLESCFFFKFDDFEFDFVDGRDAAMTTAILHDVITFCNNREYTVYGCYLDAERAFDAILHSILFYKLTYCVSDDWWLTLFHWYSDLSVCIKGNNKLSPVIIVCKGTRQGVFPPPVI